MVGYEGMFEAYYDCITRKRGSNNAMRFVLDFERSLVVLADEINNRTYQPSVSIAFVVSRPKYREVFAADFRDRIVHHWICLRLEPLMEQVFSPRTFNCRKGKGVDFGVRMLAAGIKECSENYTKGCYVATADMKGFFMSIPKLLLADTIDRFIVENYFGDDKDDLRWVTRKLILHRPELNCELRSPEWKWAKLPKNKTLRYGNGTKGMPIGNLISQIFANFFLTELDWLFERKLKIKYHGRYVDDFYIVSRNKRKILRAMPVIRNYLSTIGITLHPHKFYLQEYRHGVRFTGTVIKSGRLYIANRTIEGLKRAVHLTAKSATVAELEHNVTSLNSYLGFLCHRDTYNIRRRIFGQLPIEFHEKCSIRPDLNAVTIRKRYSRDEYRKQMLRSKSYDDILPLRLASFDDDEENGIYYNRQVIGNIRRKRRTNGSMAQPSTILQ